MSVLVFGADGGGTKTLGILSDQNGNLLAQRTVGATNVNVVGIDDAAEALMELLNGCCADAHCSLADVQAIVLGLAGAGGKEVRARLRERLCARAGSSLPLTLETDARVALEGAFDGGPGIVIIAGTGSVVMGKSASGEIVSVGGWGRTLGDEGSGYWLGLQAMKSAALYHDGRDGSEVLAEMIGREFDLRSRERILTAVYQEQFDFSRLAPMVVNAAERNDAGALQILAGGATALAAQASAVAQRLNGAARVALIGSLIQNENIYSRMLKSKIAESMPSAEIQTPLRSPAEGAVLMALRKLTYIGMKE